MTSARRRPFTEAHAPDGAPRPHYAEVLRQLAETDLGALAERLAAGMADAGLEHGPADRCRALTVDLVPRILTVEEWRALEAGLAQRVRALDAFVADAHGPREAWKAGVVPPDVLAGSVHDDPGARERPPARVRIAVAGIDLARDPSGTFRVLEDNVRTPSGLGVLVGVAGVLRGHLAASTALGPRGMTHVGDRLRSVLHSVADAQEDEPLAVILHDGAESHVLADVLGLAALAGIPAVELSDLARAGDRVVLRDGRRPVDVIYRRTNEERLRGPEGNLNAYGALLDEPLKAGMVRCVNAYGAGVADDKRVFRHVEDLVAFYLGEAPLLRGIHAYDLADPDVLADVADRLADLVLKPRGGAGGYGVVVGPDVSAARLAEARRDLLADPGHWSVQDVVVLSTHPTLVDGELVPRHVDLRPFVLFDGSEAHVVPGALSRFAARAGRLVVNAGQGGGLKDTWVLP